MGMMDSSYFVPAIRKVFGARRKVGGIFFSMHCQEIPKIVDISQIGKLFKIEPRTINRYGWFRIYDSGKGRAKAIVLHDGDKKVISEAERVAAFVNALPQDKKLVFNAVLAHLSEKEGDLI